METPATALFYDLNIHADRISIETLEKVSSHSCLGNHVRRLVFIQPPLLAGVATDDGFLKAMVFLARDFYRPKLFDSGLMPWEISSAASILAHKAFPFTDDMMDAIWENFGRCLMEQDRIVNGTVDVVGPCLARLPNLTSLVFSGDVPQSLNPDLYLLNQYVKKLCSECEYREHIPKRLLNYRPEEAEYEYEDDCAGDAFISTVLRAFASADIQLEEIIFTDTFQFHRTCLQPTPQFRWHPLQGGPPDLDLSSLRLLDIEYHSSNEAPLDADYGPSLGPLLERTISLERLRLQWWSVQRTADIRASFPKLFTLSFSKLQEFHLSGLRCTGLEISHFLSRQPLLKEITLESIRIADNALGAVFAAVRELPGLERYYLKDLSWPQGLWEPLITADRVYAEDHLENVDAVRERGNALRRFLNGEGEWTKLLIQFSEA